MARRYRQDEWMSFQADFSFAEYWLRGVELFFLLLFFCFLFFFAVLGSMRKGEILALLKTNVKFQ